MKLTLLAELNATHLTEKFAWTKYLKAIDIDPKKAKSNLVKYKYYQKLYLNSKEAGDFEQNVDIDDMRQDLINEALGITKAEGKAMYAKHKKALSGKKVLKDTKGREIVKMNKDGSIETCKYSTNGFIIKNTINATGNVKATSTDASGKVTKLLKMKKED